MTARLAAVWRRSCTCARPPARRPPPPPDGDPPEDLHALAQLPGRVPCPEEVVGRRPGRAGAARQELNVHRGRGVRRGLTPRAPARWRGSSPTRRVQRPRCAVAVGGGRGGTAPRQPLPGTREAWPQRVGWLPGLSSGRQPRPAQPRTHRLEALQEIRHLPLELFRQALHTRSPKHRVGKSRNRVVNRLFPTCLTYSEIQQSGFRCSAPARS